MPTRERVLHWGGVLGKFASVQLMVQAVTFAAGILIVRSTGKIEYAYYTIAASVLAAISILGDSGINSGFSALAGRTWKEATQFARALATALSLRRRFGVIVAVLVAPVGLWMLLRNGAAPLYSVAVLCAVMVLGYLMLITTVYRVVAQFRGDVGVLQRTELFPSLFRLTLLALLALVFLNALTALLTSIVAVVLTNRMLRGYARQHLDLAAKPDAESRAFIVKTVKMQLPTGVFYVLQSQIVILLVTIFGSASNVAEVGALGRMAVIFAVLDAISINILAPRFAKCHDRQTMTKIFLQTVGGYLAVAAVPLMLLLLFTRPILWVLGGDYIHLEAELVIFSFGCIAAAILRVITILNKARAWLVNPWVYIASTTIWLALLGVWLDLGTTYGAVLFSSLSPATGILLNLMRSLNGLIHQPRLTVRDLNSRQ